MRELVERWRATVLGSTFLAGRTGEPVSYGIGAVATVLIGWSLVWMWRSSWPLKTREEGDPLALLQLGATLLVAFFVQHYFARRTSTTRAEKDAVIGVVKDAITYLGAARKQFYVCCGSPLDEPKRQELVRELKALAAQLSTVEHLLDVCGFQLRRVQRSELGALMRRMRTSTTSSLPVTPSPSEVVAVDKAYQEGHRTLSLVIIDVNRA